MAFLSRELQLTNHRQRPFGAKKTRGQVQQITGLALAILIRRWVGAQGMLIFLVMKEQWFTTITNQ